MRALRIWEATDGGRGMILGADIVAGAGLNTGIHVVTGSLKIGSQDTASPRIAPCQDPNDLLRTV